MDFILSSIFSLLDFPSLLSCEQVCLSWKSITKNEEIWKSSFILFSSSASTIDDVKSVWTLLKGNEDIITSGLYCNPPRTPLKQQLEVLRGYESKLKDSQKQKNRKRKKGEIDAAEEEETDPTLEQLQQAIGTLTKNRRKEEQILQLQPPFWKYFYGDQYALQTAYFYSEEEKQNLKLYKNESDIEDGEDPIEESAITPFKRDHENRPYVPSSLSAAKIEAIRNSLTIMRVTREFTKQKSGGCILPNDVYVFWAFFTSLDIEERKWLGYNTAPCHVLDTFGNHNISLFASARDDFIYTIREYPGPPESLPIFHTGGDGYHFSLWYEDITKLPTKVVSNYARDGGSYSFVGKNLFEAFRFQLESIWDYVPGADEEDPDNESDESKITKEDLCKLRNLMRFYGTQKRCQVGQRYLQKYYPVQKSTFKTLDGCGVDLNTNKDVKKWKHVMPSLCYFEQFQLLEVINSNKIRDIVQFIQKNEELSEENKAALTLILARDLLLLIDWSHSTKRRGMITIYIKESEANQALAVLKQAYRDLGRDDYAEAIDNYIKSRKRYGNFFRLPREVKGVLWSEIDMKC